MVPSVSVLIPVYKVPEIYLRKCIESVINQTLQNIEIILVDDGSPDCSGAICDEYAVQDSRIRVIHKSNEGLAAARNTAFDVATGDYITFLDGDDYLEADACEKAYFVAIKQNVQMVFWNHIIDYPRKSAPYDTFGNNEKKFDKDECKDLQLKVLDFNGKIAQVFDKLIKRDFLIENNIRHVDKLSQGAEGFVFNIQLFEHLESAYYLPDHLLHYTYNEISISHSPDEKNYYLIVRCFEYVNSYIQHSENREKLQNSLYIRLLYVIVTTGVTGYFNPANHQNYREKVNGYKKFLKEPLINYSLTYADQKGLSFERKFLIFCVKHDFFIFFPLIGRIRRLQLRFL